MREGREGRTVRGPSVGRGRRRDDDDDDDDDHGCLWKKLTCAADGRGREREREMSPLE